MKDYQIEYYENMKREMLPVLKAAIETTMEKQVLDYNAQQDLYGAPRTKCYMEMPVDIYKTIPQMPRYDMKKNKLVKREESHAIL